MAAAVASSLAFRIAGARHSTRAAQAPAATGGSQFGYRPTLASPGPMQPFLEQLQPGNDAFPLEGQADGARGTPAASCPTELRGGPRRAAAGVTALLAPDVSRRAAAPGRRHRPATSAACRFSARPRCRADATLDARAFAGEAAASRRDLRDITVAEFLITSLDADGTDVRRRGSGRRSATTSSAAARRCLVSSTSATWQHDLAADRIRLAGRRVDRASPTSSAARDGRSSRRSPTRRSAATSRSSVNSASTSTPGWRRSTRC